jgi:Ribosomal S17
VFAPRYGLPPTNAPAARRDTNFVQTVKKSAKVIIERYYPKLTLDFETNKRICDEIAIIASKRLRNKVHNSQSYIWG